MKQNNQQENHIHGVLGQSVTYSATYDPTILYPIDRSLGRDVITAQTNIDVEKLTIGMDWWHCFELSWLNVQGISQVAMMRLSIPANSQSIIESKSLKLYLNSLNLTEFQSVKKVQDSIEKDLSQALQTQVTAEIFYLDDNTALILECASGKNIDTALTTSDKKIEIVHDVNAQLLQFDRNTHSQEIISQSYHSHLLRSNCPVTNQPDWGTVQIDIDSGKIDEASLLEYILTYRQHNGFHEQCVEQIFADLTQAFAPQKLMVRAWYTRRGGIDINPCRASHSELIPKPSRLVRQ